MSAPAITAIVPARNAARFLQGALDSIAAQTVRPAEVLVVEDGSTDGTRAIAEGYPGVRLVSTEGRGPAAAFNTGVRHAATPYVAFLSADDRWEPEKLERQGPLLASAPGALTLFRYFLYPGCEVPPGMNAALFGRDLVGQMPESLVVHRDFYREVGGFSEGMKIGFDVEWFAKVAERGVTFPVVPAVLVRKGVHEANLSYLAAESTPVLFDVLRASLRRRKEGSDGR